MYGGEIQDDASIAGFVVGILVLALQLEEDDSSPKSRTSHQAYLRGHAAIDRIYSILLSCKPSSIYNEMT